MRTLGDLVDGSAAWGCSLGAGPIALLGTRCSQHTQFVKQLQALVMHVSPGPLPEAGGAGPLTVGPRGSCSAGPDTLTSPPRPADRAFRSVVAVVVTHDPGPWFDERLASLRDQTYAASRCWSRRRQRRGPHRPDRRGAARRLRPAAGRRTRASARPSTRRWASVEGAAFYLLCHDDVALEPDAIRTLVEEAFRSNAGHRRPQAGRLGRPRAPAPGRACGRQDRRPGPRAPSAGELDQEQHDAVRDVFVVPGGCTLVRADLFDALGGFDAGIDLPRRRPRPLLARPRGRRPGADRAGRPGAPPRGARRAVARRRPSQAAQARHRLRTMLVLLRRSGTGSGWCPQALVLTLVEAVVRA